MYCKFFPGAHNPALRYCVIDGQYKVCIGIWVMIMISCCEPIAWKIDRLMGKGTGRESRLCIVDSLGLELWVGKVVMVCWLRLVSNAFRVRVVEHFVSSRGCAGHWHWYCYFHQYYSYYSRHSAYAKTICLRVRGGVWQCCLLRTAFVASTSLGLLPSDGLRLRLLIASFAFPFSNKFLEKFC